MNVSENIPYYQDRISELEAKIEAQDKRIRIYARKVHALGGKLEDEPIDETTDDAREYFSPRKIVCKKCHCQDDCMIKLTFTEGGKINKAYIYAIPKGWEMKPYGDAGGEAPYCASCKVK